MLTSVTVTKTVEVEVEIDTEVDISIDQVLSDMGPGDLAELGLAAVEDVLVIESAWLNVRNAMLRGDRYAATQMIADMAYSQAGVILPALH